MNGYMDACYDPANPWSHKPCESLGDGIRRTDNLDSFVKSHPNLSPKKEEGKKNYFLPANQIFIFAACSQSAKSRLSTCSEKSSKLYVQNSLGE
jgi:hypothetical protein